MSGIDVIIQAGGVSIAQMLGRYLRLICAESGWIDATRLQWECTEPNTSQKEGSQRMKVNPQFPDF